MCVCVSGCVYVQKYINSFAYPKELNLIFRYIHVDMSWFFWWWLGPHIAASNLQEIIRAHLNEAIPSPVAYATVAAPPPCHLIFCFN